MLFKVIFEGDEHDGQFAETEIISFTTPLAMIALSPSKISQLISPGHDPGFQLEVEMISPVAASNGTASKDPVHAAPAKTTTPFTETSTDPPFHPSP